MYLLFVVSSLWYMISFVLIYYEYYCLHIFGATIADFDTVFVKNFVRKCLSSGFKDT